MTLTDLRSLRDRMESGSGSDRLIDAELYILERPELLSDPYVQPNIGHWISTGGPSLESLVAPRLTESLYEAWTFVQRTAPDVESCVIASQGHVRASLDQKRWDNASKTWIRKRVARAARPDLDEARALLTAWLALLIEQEETLQAAPKIGDPARKVTGYRFDGEIRGIITTKAGRTRYVVEATGEGQAGMLHIFNGQQLGLPDDGGKA